jgi:hypothetical protein
VGTVGSGEDPRDAPSSHSGAEHLQASDEVAHEVREPIHRLVELDEGVRALIVQAFRPRRHGERGHQKPASGLGQRPAPCGSKFEDREPLDRWVVGPPLRRDALHPGVLDSNLLVEEGDLGPKAVILGLEPNPSVEVVLGLAAGDGEDDVRHRDGVDDRRSDAAWPALG